MLQSLQSFAWLFSIASEMRAALWRNSSYTLKFSHISLDHPNVYVYIYIYIHIYIHIQMHISYVYIHTYIKEPPDNDFMMNKQTNIQQRFTIVIAQQKINQKLQI